VERSNDPRHGRAHYRLIERLEQERQHKSAHHGGRPMRETLALEPGHRKMHSHDIFIENDFEK
jgi:hypothetical protein